MCLLWVVGCMVACVAVKTPPYNVPFVYENRLELKAPDLTTAQVTEMRDKMMAYYDDSLVVKSRRILGFKQRLSSPVFDSASVYQTVKYLNGYLNSQGYYYARLDTFAIAIDTFSPRGSIKPKYLFKSADWKDQHQQLRVSTLIKLDVGRSLKVDSLWYDFVDLDYPTPDDSLLQAIANNAAASSILPKGSNYSKQNVAAELDRLAALFREEGFFRMGRYALQAEVDTTDPSLIDPFIDPIEQLLIVQRRMENPTVKVRIMKKPGMDSSFYHRFWLDTVFIYPEARITDSPDSLMVFKDWREDISRRKVVIREKENLFEEQTLRRANYLLPGTLYNEKSYFRTLNNYSQMGPWQQIDVRSITMLDSVHKVKFHLFLYPAKKQSLQIDLEGSQNNNISTANVLAGRFLALSLNATHRSRNVFKRGTQSTTNGRIGFEINNNRGPNSPGFFQALVGNLNQSFSLPRLLWPFNVLDDRQLDSRKTSINAGFLYTNRFQFFTQTAFNAGLVWEARKKRNTFTFSLPNFEAINISSPGDSLGKLIAQNPALQFSFAAGNILSMRIAFERAMQYKNHSNWSGVFRLTNEITVPGNYRLFNRDFFKFYGVEGLFIHHVNRHRASWHYRAFAGVGWDLSGRPNATLPFIRQFVTGGSNSMRAWGLRQLGLGNSISSDTASFKDRFGDIQLELNAERRFSMFKLFGFNINGVFFADIGNIWNHIPSSDGLGKFSFKNLYRDLAVCVGTGVRYDLNYLVVRLDAAFKVKDPVRGGAGWLDTFEWKSSNRLPGSPRISNLGVQFGIGYPF